MSKVKSFVFLFGLAGLLIALDQFSKSYVRAHLELGESWNPIPALIPYINITYWENSGAAFGLFQSGGLVFAVVAILVSAVIVYYYGQVPPGHWLVRTALSLQLAGAVGNLIDRLTQGPVTDFIHVTNFPLFNVADSSISVGVALLAVTMLLERKGRAENRPISEAEPPPA